MRRLSKRRVYYFNQGPAGINERPLKETPRSMFDMTPKLNWNNLPVELPIIVPNESNGKEAETAKRQADIKALMDGSLTLATGFTSKYRLGDLLGDGAFGFVITATRIGDNLEVAVKFIVKSKLSLEKWQADEFGENLPKEVAVLSRLSHRNIIKYIEHIVEKDYILLVTELHGCCWNVNNPELNPTKNMGLKPSSNLYPQNIHQDIRKRTSCDLFECIDARILTLKQMRGFQRLLQQRFLGKLFLPSSTWTLLVLCIAT